MQRDNKYGYWSLSEKQHDDKRTLVIRHKTKRGEIKDAVKQNRVEREVFVDFACFLPVLGFKLS